MDIKKEIFYTLKEWLVEQIYRAIDEMMRGHYFKLNDNDKKILTGAIDRTVDRMVDVLDIGTKIEDKMGSVKNRFRGLQNQKKMLY